MLHRQGCSGLRAPENVIERRRHVRVDVPE
jgi:hypothetical protein